MADGDRRPEATRLDHVLVGIADLERGIEEMEDRTGIRPIFGGSHPELGTHNALLRLGNDLYLELIAVRPEVEDAGQFSDLRKCLEPTPVGWVIATEDRFRTAERLAAAGLSPGPFLAGSRVKKDGQRLSWHIFSLGENLLGTMPFLIDWDPGSRHPSLDSPAGCLLQGMRIFDDRPEQLGRLVALLDLPIQVVDSTVDRLEIDLETPKGRLTLGSASRAS